MLCFYIGEEGTGKTTLLRERLKKEINEGKRCIYIVPEQYHFSAERELYSCLGAGNIARVNITTFTKLSGELVSACSEPRPYAPETVKPLLLYRALQSVRPTLTTVPERSPAPRISAAINGEITSLKQSGVRPEALSAMAEKKGIAPRLSARLRDLSTVYGAYQSLLSTKYSDRLDDTLTASSIAGSSELICGSVIFLDGFDGFGGSEWALIRTLLTACEDMHITVLTDAMESAKQEYRFSNGFIERLSLAAKDAEQECVTVKAEQPRRSPSARLIEARSVYEECDRVAADIRHAVVSGECRYKETAILIRDRSYFLPLRGALAKYGVSGFSDLPESIAEKPLVKFFLQVLSASALGTEDVLAYIKSGFVRVKGSARPGYANVCGRSKPVIASLTKSYSHLMTRRGGAAGVADEVALAEEKERSADAVASATGRSGRRRNTTERLSRSMMNRLERLVLENRPRKSDWETPVPKSIDSSGTLERTREDIIGALKALRESISNTTGDKITEALTDFIVNKMELRVTIFALCNTAKGYKRGFDRDERRTAEYRRLWDMTVSVLESFHSALRGVDISPEDYAELLSAAFSSVKLSRPPQVIDAVTIGDTERSRSGRIKRCYLLGFTAAAYPAPYSSALGLTGEETEMLLSEGLEIADNRRERFDRERFSVSRAFSLPSDTLIVSYPRQNIAMEEAEASSFIGMLLPEVKPERTTSAEQLLATEKAALQRLAVIGGGNGAERRAIEECYGGEYKPREPMKLSSETAEKLFNGFSYSPSSLETLAGCPFRFFLTYGLRINEQKAEGLNPAVRGNIVHFILQSVLEHYLSDYSSFIKEEENGNVEKLAREAAQTYADEHLGGQYCKTERYNRFLREITDSTIAMLKHLRREMDISGFRPKKLEEKVTIEISEGIKISGKLDRTDVLEKSDKKYVRVIDYKTGAKQLRLSDLDDGLNLQMLLYLFSVCDGDKTLLPSGAVYYPAGQESPSATTLLLASKKEALRESTVNTLKAFKPSGVSFAESAERDDVIDLETLRNEYECLAQTTRTSFFDITELKEDEYDKLRNKIAETIAKEVEGLRSGMIPPSPIADEQGKPVACAYCQFSEVCGFDGETGLRRCGTA